MSLLPPSITDRYAGPVSCIRIPELRALLLTGNGGHLMSSGRYPVLEEHNGIWSLMQFCGPELLSFCPHDLLVVYGRSVDIWRADDSEESRSYYLLDSLQFVKPVQSLLDNLEEPLL